MANRQRRVPVTADEVRAVVATVFVHEGAGEPNISVALVNDHTIRRVNQEHLGHDWATDSLAFPYDDHGEGIAGEVVVSGETALREAAARGTNARHELLLYVAHGTLHLLGWHDDTPARRRRMNARAASLVARAGIRDAAP